MNVSRTVTATDSLKIQLSLLGILPEEEMLSLLCEELEASGWNRDKKGEVSTQVGEVRAELSKDGKEVTLSSSARTEVTARSTDKQSAENQLQSNANRAEESLKEQAMQRLAKVEPDIRAKLGEAVQRVYIKALQKKAASMGQVESVLENRNQDGEYEVTIKVKV